MTQPSPRSLLEACGRRESQPCPGGAPEAASKDAVQTVAAAPARPWPGLGLRGLFMTSSGPQTGNDGLPGPADDDPRYDGVLTQMAAAQAPVGDAFCPCCGSFLADIGLQQAQDAHVAACTQRRAAEKQSEEGTGDEEGNQSEAEEEGQGAAGGPGIADWLAERGLEKYAANFERAGERVLAVGCRLEHVWATAAPHGQSFLVLASP